MSIRSVKVRDNLELSACNDISLKHLVVTRNDYDTVIHDVTVNITRVQFALRGRRMCGSNGAALWHCNYSTKELKKTLD